MLQYACLLNCVEYFLIKNANGIQVLKRCDTEFYEALCFGIATHIFSLFVSSHWHSNHPQSYVIIDEMNMLWRKKCLLSRKKLHSPCMIWCAYEGFWVTTEQIFIETQNWAKFLTQSCFGAQQKCSLFLPISITKLMHSKYSFGNRRRSKWKIRRQKVWKRSANTKMGMNQCCARWSSSGGGPVDSPEGGGGVRRFRI